MLNLKASSSVNFWQSRSDVSPIKVSNAKPCSLGCIAMGIEGKHDLNIRLRRAETCNLEQGSRLWRSDRAQQASPRKNDSQSLGDAFEFCGKHFERLGDADQVQNSATRRLARGLPSSLKKAIGVCVGCNE